MSGRKKKNKRPWWRKAKNGRRIGIAAAALALALIGLAVLVRGGEETRYNTRFASQFTLPTTTGEDVRLDQHLGRHNVLLYFNEGMG